ncbi:MAG: ferritin family protein [Chitinispirillaceae bacterium]|nr:ferritin family protein [Chitinispirillaceae bacterium]
MAIMSFCAEEIIDRAIEIEQTAKEFYRNAAISTKNDTIHSFFETLAVIEGEHERTFREIKMNLSENERQVEINDPGNEMLFYLDGLKEIQAWEARSGNGDEENNESTREVIRTALRAEKETVRFYTFLYDYVPPARGLDKVDAVIREERNHVAQLQNVLDRMEGITRER